MKAKLFGMLLKASISLVCIFTICAMFVDDNKMSTASTRAEGTGEEQATLFQGMLDYWVGLTSATGGAINVTTKRPTAEYRESL